jgi:uroporphyrinogen-III synthase
MRIAIELPEAQAGRLQEEALRLGIQPEELARAAVVDLLQRDPSDFDSAAAYVLKKNRELYQRLS